MLYVWSECCVVEWKHVIFIMNLLCVGGSEIHIYILVLFVVLAACCTFGLRKVCLGGSVLYV